MLKATILLCAITGLIFLLDTLSYSLRLVVYRNQQYNLTASTYNMISLVAKTVIVFQMPLLGVLLDVSITGQRDPINDFRLILLWAAVGVALAIVLLPWFIPLFTKLVDRISQTGTYWGAVFSLFKARQGLGRAIVKTRSSGLAVGEWRALWQQRNVLLLHGAITAVYAVGLLSAYYAAYLYPSHRMTLAGFSGVINGFATILMTIVLEPHIAMVTDKTLKGETEYSHLKGMVLALVVSKLGGVLLAQVIFVPASLLHRIHPFMGFGWVGERKRHEGLTTMDSVMQNRITVKGFNLLPQMNADEDRWVLTYLSVCLSISNVAGARKVQHEFKTCK